jgi:hypothetical protein
MTAATSRGHDAVDRLIIDRFSALIPANFDEK